MNLELNHETQLSEILKQGSLLDIVRLFGGGSPAFLAAVVKAHTQQHNRQR